MNVGLIGCGRWGMAHLSTLLHLKEQGAVSAIHVCDIDPNRLVNLPSGVDGAHTDIESMLAKTSPDFAAIATPSHTHSDIGSMLLELEIPTLVEKPMGVNVSSLQQLIQSSRKAGTPFFSGYLLRHHSGFQLAKQLLDVANKPRMNTLSFFRHSTRAPPTDGDAVRRLASHAVDLLTFLGAPHSIPSIQVEADESLGQVSINLHFTDPHTPLEAHISVGWGFENERREATIQRGDDTYHLEFNVHDSIRIGPTSTGEVRMTESKLPPLHAQYLAAFHTVQMSEDQYSEYLQTAHILDAIEAKIGSV